MNRFLHIFVLSVCAASTAPRAEAATLYWYPSGGPGGGAWNTVSGNTAWRPNSNGSGLATAWSNTAPPEGNFAYFNQAGAYAVTIPTTNSPSTYKVVANSGAHLTLDGAGTLSFTTGSSNERGFTANRPGFEVGSGSSITVTSTIAPSAANVTKSGQGDLYLGNAGFTTLTPGSIFQVIDGVLDGVGTNRTAINGARWILNGAPSNPDLNAVVQTHGAFSKVLATGAIDNAVVWFAGSGGNPASTGGGFAARGGALDITLTDGVSPVTPTWGTTSAFLPTGATLIFGSTTADNLATLTNDFSLGTSGTNTRTVKVVDNPNLTTDAGRLSGVITGSSGNQLVKTGDGTLILSGANTYAGATTINAGTLVLTGGAAIADSSTVDLANVAGATLRLDASETIGLLTGGGASGGNVQLQNHTLTVNVTSTSVFYGALSSGSGGELIKAGGSALALLGNNSGLAGSVTINQGSVIFQHANAGSAAAAWNLAATGTALTINGDAPLGGGNTLHLGALTGVVGSTLRNGGTTANTTFAGAITNSPTLPLTILTAITKVGGGTLTLTGANTYTGVTTINGGTLLVNGTHTGTGGAYSVNSGGRLGGTGSIARSVTFNSGGTLAPGASIESLVTGALTFNHGSTFAYEIDSAAPLNLAADLQRVNGALNLNGTVNLTLSDLSPSNNFQFLLGTTFSLLNYDAGDWNGGLFTFGSNQLTDLEVFASGKYFWQIDYAATSGGLNFASEYNLSGNFINLTLMGLTIPEPSTFLLLALALGSLGLVRRFQRKSQHA